jgi:hypothetical protein
VFTWYFHTLFLQIYLINFQFQTQVRCLGNKNVEIKNPSAAIYPEKGVEAAKRPAKVKLQAGKTYSYCNCGLSVRQVSTSSQILNNFQQFSPSVTEHTKSRAGPTYA